MTEKSYFIPTKTVTKEVWQKPKLDISAPHFNGQRFFNPWEREDRNQAALFKWILCSWFGLCFECLQHRRRRSLFTSATRATDATFSQIELGNFTLHVKRLLVGHTKCRNDAVRRQLHPAALQPLLPFNAVHTPLQVPEKYKEPYAAMQGNRRTYAAMTTAMDEAIGRIIAAIEARGWRTNTLIIFSSDNGGPNPGRLTSNGPLRAGKGTVYEGGVKVCAFANWPGQIKSNSVVNAPLHIADWYPTLLKLAGASLEQKLPLDGRDAWTSITAGAPSPHDAILINATPNKGALRMGDWKLVVNGDLPEAADGDGETAPTSAKKPAATASASTVELFNLVEDPSEKTNLAAERADKVKELRARYDAFAKQQVAPKAAPKAKGFQVPKVWGEKD